MRLLLVEDDVSIQQFLKRALLESGYRVDTASTAKAGEALALEGARSGRLTTEQVRRLLGYSTRYEADGFLKQHGVYYDLTAEDVQNDAATALQFSQCSSSPTRPR